METGGPAGYLWMWPLANVFGSHLSPVFIYALEFLVAVACIWLTLLIFGNPERYLFEIPLYSVLWLSSTSFKYRLYLEDINSLFGFCLFPFIAMYFLSKRKQGAGGAAIALGAHFRILSVGQAVYFSLRNWRTFRGVILTSIVILALGTLLISPYQGYLYWWRLVQDVAFKGSGVQSAAAAWHENISISGILLKFGARFYYGNANNLDVSDKVFHFCMRLGAVIQVVLTCSIFYVLWRTNTLRKHFTIDAEKARRLLFLELGFASLLTYALTPEYGNDFLVTLMPLFCVGIYEILLYGKEYGTFWKGAFGLSWILTYNIFGTSWACKILPLAQWSRAIGNQKPFVCYELYNIFLLPVFGIGLATLFLVQAWRRQVEVVTASSKQLDELGHPEPQECRQIPIPEPV